MPQVQDGSACVYFIGITSDGLSELCGILFSTSISLIKGNRYSFPSFPSQITAIMFSDVVQLTNCCLRAFTSVLFPQIGQCKLPRDSQLSSLHSPCFISNV